MAYIGNSVENQGFTPAIDYFNGDGTTVTFTLSRPVVSVAQMIVAIENVVQNPSTAFTVSGNEITFTSAPPSGSNNIWVEYTSLITQYNAISQDPSVIGDITATGGFLATGDFGNTFTDGTIVDYVTGNARITTGPADGVTIYNGGPTARVSLAAWDSSGNLTNTGGAVIQGLTVGKGGGAVGSNTAIGQNALAANTSGNNNAALSYNALLLNTTGSNNSAAGLNALYSNTSGSQNTAFGRDSLLFNTTASNNVAVGYQAGYAATTSTSNVFVGVQAGYSLTATGDNRNTFVGPYAGYFVTTGTKNTIIGGFNGLNNGPDIRTASNYIVLADGDGNARIWSDNQGTTRAEASATDFYTFIARNTQATRPYGVYINFSASTPNNTTESFLDCSDSTNSKCIIYSNGTVSNRTGTYNTISDAKLKENIVNATPKLDKLMQVQVRNYNLIGDELKQIGFVAQELENIFPALIDNVPDLDENKQPTGEVTKGVKLTVMIPILVKAIQEQQAMIEELKTKVAALEAK